MNIDAYVTKYLERDVLLDRTKIATKETKNCTTKKLNELGTARLIIINAKV